MELVVAVSPVTEMVGVSVVGLATDPYTTVPVSLVISTSEVDVAVDDAKVSVSEVTVSDPMSVCSVKVSEVVADPPGKSVVDAVSLPVPNVVTGPTVIGVLGARNPKE